MAKVGEITPETIELMRGKIDFYMLRGILPVARSWPKKPKPPYTDLQAENMEAFSIANKSMRELRPKILEEWRVLAVGKKASWTDTYRKIVMNYWKKYRSIPAMAVDYEIIETADTVKVVWDILQISLKNEPPPNEYKVTSNVVDKSEIGKGKEPIYFTLYDEEKVRVVAPWIKYEG
jgi:hypothetical protein